MFLDKKQNRRMGVPAVFEGEGWWMERQSDIGRTSSFLPDSCSAQDFPEEAAMEMGEPKLASEISKKSL